MKSKAKLPYFKLKMLTSYLLIIFILLTCVFSSFFYFIIRSKTEDISEYSRKAMEDVSYSAEVLYKQIEQVGNSLLSDLSIKMFLSDPESDAAFEYSIFNRLRNLRLGYPYIQSILLYQQENQKMLSDVYGNTLASDTEFTQELQRLISERSIFSEMDIPVLSYNHNTTEEVLAFFFYPLDEINSEYSRAITIFIRKEYFEEFITNISVNPLNRFLLLDASGKMVLSTESEFIPDSLDVSPLLSEISLSEQNSGRTSLPIDGSTYWVTYSKADTLNWIFCSISSSDNELKSLLDLLTILGIISFCLLIFGLFTTIVVTHWMYSPLKALTDRALHSSDLSPQSSSKG